MQSTSRVTLAPSVLSRHSKDINTLQLNLKGTLMKSVAVNLFFVLVACCQLTAVAVEPIDSIELHRFPNYRNKLDLLNCYPLDLNQRFRTQKEMGPFIYASWTRGAAKPITDLMVKVYGTEQSGNPEEGWFMLPENINEKDPVANAQEHVYLHYKKETGEDPIRSIYFMVTSDNDPNTPEDYEFCVDDDNQPVSVNAGRPVNIFVLFSKVDAKSESHW